jgi:hypothetical protein
MLPFPGILQRYVKFDTHNITTLEKLLGGGSFGGFISHLACHQATFLTSLGGFGLLSIVWIATPIFLGCWALITLAFVTRPIDKQLRNHVSSTCTSTKQKKPSFTHGGM